MPRGSRAIVASSLAATPPIIIALATHPLVAIAIAVAVNVTALVVHSRACASQDAKLSKADKCLWQPRHEKDFGWAREAAFDDKVAIDDLVDRPIESAVDLIERHLGPAWARCFQCLPHAREAVKHQHVAERGDAPTATVGVTPTEVPTLSDPERERVGSGKTVIIRPPNTTGGLAVQRVRAPAEMVWATLNDFGKWSQMVDHCTGTDVYCDTTGESGGAHGVVDMKISLGVAFVGLVAHVHQIVDRGTGRLTWTLDEAKPNDCVKHAGYWLIRPDPSSPTDASLVYYSADVELSPWIPGWLNSFISEQGLPLAVGWLRREAERRAA